MAGRAGGVPGPARGSVRAPNPGNIHRISYRRYGVRESNRSCRYATKHGRTSGGNIAGLSLAQDRGDRLMLTFQLIGATFLLLCLAPLLTRDPTMRRPAR